MDNFGKRMPSGGPPMRPRPQRPIQTESPVVLDPAVGQPRPQTQLQPQPLGNDTGLVAGSPKKSRKKRLLIIFSSLIVLAVAILGGVWAWYDSQLKPVDVDSTEKIVVTIESGSTPSVIAEQLHTEGLIRNPTVFQWHARLEGVQNKLQAGIYRLSKSESTPEIVTHLVSGRVDTFDITFLPGATVKDNKKIFLEAGYDQQEVDSAFAADYDSPLFADKVAGSDLEGYIYPETYSFGTSASVGDILNHIFSYYYEIIKQNDLIGKFESQGLTLYEGITMASIIQKEAIGGDEAQIAQVFLTRYRINMPLGSDVTYQYIADKEGNPRDINYDSPYNTRRYTGLPPGPISAPGLVTLKATANPAEGDYLYFLSGDDDVTYFARTFAEHEANIRNHCQKKCQII